MGRTYLGGSLGLSVNVCSTPRGVDGMGCNCKFLARRAHALGWADAACICRLLAAGTVHLHVLEQARASDVANGPASLRPAVDQRAASRG
jgi:hypothetical protein